MKNYVNNYVHNNTMVSQGLEIISTFGNISDGGLLKDFKDLADTYDNSLAIIYYTATNDFEKAKRLADSWIQILVWTGWNTVDITDMNLLRARYKIDGTWWTENLVGDTMYRDVGNNSYMALALAKFGATFSKRIITTRADTENNIYTRAAISIMTFIHEKRGRKVKFGNNDALTAYAAREAPKDYLSTEHHIDMYALANIVVQTPYISDSVKSLCRTIMTNVRAYMGAVHDIDKGTYMIGTVPVLTAGRTFDKNAEYTVYLNTDAPTPVDCQTWAMLTGMDDLDDDNKQKSGMEWVKEYCYNHDHYRFTKNGVVPECTNKNGSVDDCESPDVSYTGIRFTDKGDGIQLENTGSGLMALARYSSISESDDSSDYSESIESISRSIDELTKRFPDGMVASLFDIKAVESYGAPDQNTGLTWSYAAVPHLASTLYCILARLYITAQKNPEIYNPYSSHMELREGYMVPDLDPTSTDFGKQYSGITTVSDDYYYVENGKSVRVKASYDILFGYFFETQDQNYFIISDDSVKTKIISGDSIFKFFSLESIHDIRNLATNHRFLNQDPLLQWSIIDHIYSLLQKPP